MNITASSKYDQKTIIDLTRFTMYKKHNPKTQMSISAALFALVIVYSLFYLIFADGGTFAIGLLLAGVLLLLAIGYTYFVFPKIRYKRLGKMAELCHTFHFTDDAFTVNSLGDEYSASGTIAYTMLYQVQETNTYLFLYQNKHSVFVVDKSTIRGGTIDELRTAFSSIHGLRYIRCNY